MSSVVLPPLPYALDALEPHISAQTLHFHYEKHHQTYVSNLNALISGTDFENKPLEEIIRTSSGAIFNNAAQVFNHTFYFDGLSLNKPITGHLLKRIEHAFKSFDSFCYEFKKAALALFGSGWVWLVKKGGSLHIETTSNAAMPVHKPLLTCDVWEHAYYLDYKNRRADYIDIFLKHLIHWDVIEKRFGHSS